MAPDQARPLKETGRYSRPSSLSKSWAEGRLLASNLGLEAKDFGYAPFDQRGGLSRVHQLFGADLPQVSDELNRELAAWAGLSNTRSGAVMSA